MSTTATHTPGPWILKAGRALETPHGEFSLTYGHDRHGNPNFKDFCALDANARLIAAAPELLAQLKSLLEMFDHDAAHQPDPITAGEMIDATLATIAKAEGVQP